MYTIDFHDPVLVLFLIPITLSLIREVPHVVTLRNCPKVPSTVVKAIVIDVISHEIVWRIRDETM